MLRTVRKLSYRFSPVAESPNASSSSRYASRPASLVTLLFTNASLTVRWKSTRNSPFRESHFGFPLRRGGIGRKSLMYRGQKQVPCQSGRGIWGLLVETRTARNPRLEFVRAVSGRPAPPRSPTRSAPAEPAAGGDQWPRRVAGTSSLRAPLRSLLVGGRRCR